MKKTAISLFMVLMCMLFAVPASAHTLWINLYECFAHPPGHAIASIGWGHRIPLDDLLDQLTLASYELVDPECNRTSLPLPIAKKDASFQTASGIEVSVGDAGLRKLRLTDKVKPGTYQVALASADNYYSTYLDEKGHKKWVPKAMNQVEGAKEVLAGMKYKSYAKAFFTVGGKWTEPNPLGNDLELMPLTDLSRVHAGDMVSFSVTLLGKPLTTMPEKSLEYITATSNTFGGPDGFFLAAMLHKGKGSFRFPTAGQWVVNVYTSYDVDPAKDPKELVEKCSKVFYAGTISFDVKP